MKIKYTFDNGETVEVEVSEEIGSAYLELNRTEENANRRERYHCISLDAFDYEGTEFCEPDFTDELFDETQETGRKVRDAFSHLNETQKRRLLMLSEGLSERKIARREGVTLRAIQECIDGARKKFMKFF